MSPKRAMALCAITVVIAQLSLGPVGCTRSKKEAPTPAVSVATPTLTAPAPAPTSAPTTLGPGTDGTPVAGPTTVTALDPSPTPLIVVTVVPPSTPVPQQVEYTVQLGDTLTSIAANFGTTADAIMALNGLSNANLISAGQVLLIPGQSSSIVGANEYVVVAGDTLYSIAQRFGTTVAAIQRANGIVNPALIRAGQKLTIPPAGSQPPTTVAGTYVVQAGDTLYGIAAYLGKNVWDIIAANNLTDPYLIYPGQALTTP